MKNIKSLILIVTLTTSALVSSMTLATPFSISAQTGKDLAVLSARIGKNLCKYVALPIALATTMNGLFQNETVNGLKIEYKLTNLTQTSAIFMSRLLYLVPLAIAPIVIPIQTVFGINKKGVSSPMYFKNELTIGGALGVVGSIAGMRGFDRLQSWLLS